MAAKNQFNLAKRIIRGFANIRQEHAESVISLGNFDGVHLGHQQLILHVIEKAKALNKPSLIIIFEPQPIEFFSKREQTVARLSNFREKVSEIFHSGIDFILVLPFNQKLASLSAQEFLQLIFAKIKPSFITIGQDFRFGAKRLGDLNYLQAYASKRGVEIYPMPNYNFQGERISSTRIRMALQQDDIPTATGLLGRPYSMQGYIRHGDKLGRELGFPTANIFLHRKLSPVLGIYTVYMHGIAAEPLAGVAYIGTRPAVDGSKTLLEVHLLNFQGDIYGRYVTIEFCKKIRAEKWFANLELLKDAIANDVKLAEKYFNNK